MDELLRRMSEATAGESWRAAGQTVVAGVSGGPDSMVLLHLLQTLAERENFRVVAAHVNHRFRGAEADAEMELVRQTAASWGTACEAAVIDVPAYIAETGLNPQEAAREKRYGFLRETARRHGARAIALGHHADDQAETVLMRVLRGTGIGGLAGIPFKRREEELELIRPLLRITKGELLSYAGRHAIPYAIDSSNADRHYSRNAVRLDLLPALEHYNPQVRASLLRLADVAAIEDDYMEAAARAAMEETAARSGEGWTIDGRRFRRLHIALQCRLIKLILNYAEPPLVSFDYERARETAAAIAAESPAAARMDLGGGWICLREYDRTYIGPAPAARRPFEYAVTDPNGKVIVREAEASFLFRRMGAFGPGLPDSPWEAYFDESSLRLPLVVRSRRPGDRIAPLGLNGSKKVQDMFVDAKVPRSLRDKVPVLVDAEGTILWIPGLRRSRHALPIAGAAAVHVKVGGDSAVLSGITEACSK